MKKTAKNYIESEYGIAHLIDIMRFEDTTSMLDIMQDFSDYNLKESKTDEMLEMLKDIVHANKQGNFEYLNFYQMEQLVKEATTL